MEYNRQKPRVLVLDDDRTSLYVLSRLLEADGLEVIEFSEPQEAFRWLERDLPDLILLDIVMPTMNGYEVCQMLKSGTRTRDIPLIFLTAKTDSQDIVKGLEAGAVDYVKKPFESRELLARVHTHVELKCNRDRVLHLLEEQRIDIGVAKQVLRLVDGPPVKRVLLPNGAQLFAEVLLQPCREQGGDHAFFMSLPATPAYPAGRTIISLKDQSGHDVGCVIRSIFSDLVHCGLMFSHSDQSLASLMTAVNREICQAGLGRPDHFFTALTLELDHADLTLRGISMGHPPLILIRNGAARLFPEPAGPGWSLPVGVDGLVELTVQETRLEPGDKLVLYTDGLIEMPSAQKKQRISPLELARWAERLLADEPDLPVSRLTRRLLAAVAESCGETVLPGGDRNTSADDVTVLGVELEREENWREAVFSPANTQELEHIIWDLFGQIATEWESHGFLGAGTRLRVVLEEGLHNAWQHGNKSSADRRITVRWAFGNDARLEILDEGSGFDYRQIPDPRTREGRLKLSGRGTFLMRFYSSSLFWRDGGRRVCALFRVEPEDHLDWRKEMIPLWRVPGQLEQEMKNGGM